jgi:hypothetical protein
MLEGTMYDNEVKKTLTVPANSGPGPDKLAMGTNQEGYLGLVPAAQFINGTELAAAIKLTAGSAISANVNSDWQKFLWKGKVLFIPLKGFRTGVTWVQLYNLGAVLGTDTVGLYPQNTPVVQKARVVIQGKTYRVRLMKTVQGESAPIDPQGLLGLLPTGRCDDSHYFENSEYNQLMYRSCKTPPRSIFKLWANFAAGDLNNNWVMCQETSSKNTTTFICRGNPADGIGSGICVSKSLTALATWKPVLELIT